MGASNSHDETIEASETNDAYQTKYEIETVLKKPFTELEGSLVENLYGYKCMWQDAGDYQFRLLQIEIINHAIQTLCSELWQAANVIDFQNLKMNTMTYKNAYGDVIADHPWKILSNDALFTSNTEKENDFMKFELYPADLTTVSPERKLDDFKKFLLIFRKLRDFLIKTMAKSCADVH